MKVPLLDTRRQNLPLEEELMAACRRVLHSGQFILGSEVERFERSAAELAGTRYAIGVSSGTDAILVALMALGVGAGDEVICPALTFFATAGCIARLGAKPVFADSQPDSFNVDPESIQRAITPRTKAIIPVHLFGQPADMDEILELAGAHGIAVIEDNAQSFGSMYRGRPAGSMGAFGTVSFFPSKNLGALGDAGLLVTNDPGLAERAQLLRNHGEHTRYHHSTVGGNFRLDALQAAFLAVKLPHLAEYTAKRQLNAGVYTETLAACSETAECKLLAPTICSDRSHIFNQYTVRVCAKREWNGGAESARDTLRRRLQERGIATAVYYPVPLHLQECFRGLGPYPELPVAERLATDVLSLPIFPELTIEERNAVVTAIGAATQMEAR